MKLKEIAYSHYMPEKRARRRTNTCEGYESALRLHVVPRTSTVTHLAEPLQNLSTSQSKR